MKTEVEMQNTNLITELEELPKFTGVVRRKMESYAWVRENRTKRDFYAHMSEFTDFQGLEEGDTITFLVTEDTKYVNRAIECDKMVEEANTRSIDRRVI